jgi:hypothetical protein
MFAQNLYQFVFLRDFIQTISSFFKVTRTLTFRVSHGNAGLMAALMVSFRAGLGRRGKPRANNSPNTPRRSK